MNIISNMKHMNWHRTDLDLLVVFDEVARARSVTGAAAALSLSQPAVSHALKRLRNLMRDPLFLRGRDGLVLTPRASAAVVEVRAILASVTRLVDGDRFVAGSTARTFHIACSDYAMMTLVPPIVACLRRRAAFATLKVSQIDAASPARMETGDVDLGFYALTRPPGAFRERELFRETMTGLVCARHPLASRFPGGKPGLEDYLAFPHAVVTLPGPAKSPVDVALEEIGRSRRIGMITPNFAANIAALGGSDLVMSLPSRLARAQPRRATRNFQLPIEVPSYPYLMVWHERVDADPALIWLRKQIVDAVSGGAGAIHQSNARIRQA